MKRSGNRFTGYTGGNVHGLRYGAGGGEMLEFTGHGGFATPFALRTVRVNKMGAAGRPLSCFSTTAVGHPERQVRVGQSQQRRGAERRHYDPQQPFTPRWQLYVTQRPLGRIASMPATGRVDDWRGGDRCGISVAAPFGSRCPTSNTMAPFPVAAHRTGHADFPYPALGQDIMLSPTESRVCQGRW